MNTNNFKTFVEALEALPANIKNNDVNLSSAYEPTCNTVGCFGGLISIVAEDIPELKGFYKGKFYDYHAWKLALNEYLECNFTTWAKYYPKVWDNVHGGSMFSNPEAFGVGVFYQPGGFGTNPVPLKPLTHYVIIVHIRKAYDRWIKLTEEN